MGFFKAMKRRSAARDERIYQAAYEKAIGKGKTTDEAAKAGRRAVRRRKTMIIAAANSSGGGS